MRPPSYCSTTTTSSNALLKIASGVQRAGSVIAPFVVALSVLTVSACAPPSAHGLDHDALDNAIASAIGDPGTCLLLADRASGKVIYRYGDEISCHSTRPACDAAGVMNAYDALPMATRPGGRRISCPASADGSVLVGWAAGRVTSAKRDVVYSAVMEGPNALPGQIMASRLDNAFLDAGV